jgi:hypothetical protein
MRTQVNKQHSAGMLRSNMQLFMHDCDLIRCQKKQNAQRRFLARPHNFTDSGTGGNVAAGDPVACSIR